MKSKYSYLSKNVLLFSISNFVPKLLSIILIPIYTSCLTTEEYGVSDMILTTVSMLLPIFTLDIQDAVLRFAMDKSYKREDVFSSALRIILTGMLIITLGTVVLSALGILILDITYLFFFLIMYFITAVQNTTSLFCRAIDKINVMVVSSILNSVVTLVANILFLIVFRLGVVGFLLANTIGSATALIYCFIGAKLHKYISLHISNVAIKDMIKYSFPLIFNCVAWWINNASDRYILLYFSSMAVCGLYAVSYKIPNILSMFLNIFTQAWSVSAIKEFDADDTDGFIGEMYTLMSGAMIFTCSCVMIVNRPLAGLLYTNFYEAWQYAPPLMVSIVFNALALFIGSVFTAVKDTKIVAYSTIIGAVVNTIFNFILIGLFGAYGAAIATLIGYAVTFIIRYITLKKYIRIKVNLFRDIVGYIVLICQMIIASISGITELVQLAFLIAIILLYRIELISAVEKLYKKMTK